MKHHCPNLDHCDLIIDYIIVWSISSSFVFSVVSVTGASPIFVVGLPGTSLKDTVSCVEMEDHGFHHGKRAAQWSSEKTI